ncbi:glycoside hydrolase family 2, partial [bacterium]
MAHLKTIFSRTLVAATMPFACGQFSALASAQVSARAASIDRLAQGFASPPATMRPRCYWYWMDNKSTKEGITKDLEGMARVGIGEAYIGIIGGTSGDTGPGGVPTFSEEWWQLMEHAIREGGRLGVDIGVFNGPGWSQSGGPWVKPEQMMRHVVSSEIRVKGPQRLEAALGRPGGAIQDIATLAFPAPAEDGDSIANRAPKITGGAGLERLFDGILGSTAGIPGGKEVTIEVAQPYTARSLTIYPGGAVDLTGRLQVSDDGTHFRDVSEFKLDRRVPIPQLGADTRAPVIVVFPATTARFFRLTFSAGGELSEIVLSSAARVQDYSRQKLDTLFQSGQPPFDFYVWPKQAEPENASFSVPTKAVQNISSHLAGDKLTWEVPAGDWIIQRLAMAPTGVY